MRETLMIRIACSEPAPCSPPPALTCALISLVSIPLDVSLPLLPLFSLCLSPPCTPAQGPSPVPPSLGRLIPQRGLHPPTPSSPSWHLPCHTSAPLTQPHSAPRYLGLLLFTFRHQFHRFAAVNCKTSRLVARR
ncbi:unnamed protein product [Pleuronectes platessa]|uniref:Uncharacterized protein n=1 Tax=Pleuronectes platessa TaxID=8262 RepID=A0A9N7TQF7_PLEPL|nr:unnamed protein product [Pleuronectes platessa]